VLLITDKQTERQANKQTNKQTNTCEINNLLGGGNYQLKFVIVKIQPTLPTPSFDSKQMETDLRNLFCSSVYSIQKKQTNKKCSNFNNVYSLNHPNHNQNDIEQLSKTTRLTRTALTVALNK